MPASPLVALIGVGLAFLALGGSAQPAGDAEYLAERIRPRTTYLEDQSESIVASKDLMLAFFAGIYVLWNLRRRAQERRQAAHVRDRRSQ